MIPHRGLGQSALCAVKRRRSCQGMNPWGFLLVSAYQPRRFRRRLAAATISRGRSEHQC